MDNPVRTLPVIQPDALISTPPVFEKVAVIGLGLIGGSIALACKEAWPKCLVIAVDKKMVLEQAMVRHAIDIAADDLVVICRNINGMAHHCLLKDHLVINCDDQALRPCFLASKRDRSADQP